MQRELHRRGPHPGRGRKPIGLTIEKPTPTIAELLAPFNPQTIIYKNPTHPPNHTLTPTKKTVKNILSFSTVF